MIIQLNLKLTRYNSVSCSLWIVCSEEIEENISFFKLKSKAQTYMYNSEFYMSIGAFFIAIKFVIFVILTVEKNKLIQFQKRLLNQLNNDVYHKIIIA